MTVSGDGDVVQEKYPWRISTGERTGSEWGKLLSRCPAGVVDVTLPRGIHDDVVIATMPTVRRSSLCRRDMDFPCLWHTGVLGPRGLTSVKSGRTDGCHVVP